MAGLLSGVLPAIYSRADALKRGLLDFAQNPVASLEQTAGGILDAAKAQEQRMGQAFANPQRPLQVTDQNALAQATQAMMAGPLGFAPAGITVWHGSPHTFSKFDASKIGTGEGAQAYGHGLYFAEAPETAAFYKEKLTSDQTINSYKQKLEARARALKATADRVEKSDPARAAKLRLDAESFNPEGSLYKVDLPDEAVAKMLDWDKPLSQQPQAVKDALDKVGGPFTKQALKSGQSRGGQVYMTDLQNDFPDALAATQALQQAGITGIRYLDQGSRGTGQGTSNFVVFPGNEGLLSILERNGKPVR